MNVELKILAWRVVLGLVQMVWNVVTIGIVLILLALA